ncbi:MAG: NAD(P)-dependent oxidoreductase [Hyphomicrobiaceae bacterium]
MTHRRVLITGGGGMLGNAIYPYFKARCEAVLATDIKVADDQREWLGVLDARDEAEMRRISSDFRPDLILHLAAWTDLEHCERFPKEAEEHCALTALNAAECARENDATVVYISTAGVFDGTKADGLYSEDVSPNPIMVYGAVKLKGEDHVRAVGGRHYVVRAGWMIGGGQRNDHKFVSLIIDQLRAGAKVIRAVDDKFGTPTYTHDFAMNLFALLELDAFGTYHMACQGNGTRYDVARELVRLSRFSDVEVVPVSSDFFKERYFAPRPRSEMLVNQRLSELGINHMRRWDVALKEYLEAEYRDLVSP